MGRQRNMFQLKEQKKSPGKKELNEVEGSTLPDMESKTKVMRMLKKLRGRRNEINEDVNKEIVSMK